MKLVFIHGWGLAPAFWDDVTAYLNDLPQRHIDLGFFGPESLPIAEEEPLVLVGHSLGFVHGLRQNVNWRGWIAINSFPRFVKAKSRLGCTSAAELREIRTRLKTNPEKTLRDFHKFIGTSMPIAGVRGERLAEALDELHDGDVGGLVETLVIPGMVLAARNDPLVPIKTTEALGKNREIRWHDKGGHILPQSDPFWCATAIRNFVKSHE